MSDPVVSREPYESVFQRKLVQFLKKWNTFWPFGEKKFQSELSELLDEYAIVITKRLEGVVVSAETSMHLEPHDLGQIILALAARERQLETSGTVEDRVYTQRLLARAREMLASYGPRQPDDVSWPELG